MVDVEDAQSGVITLPRWERSGSGNLDAESEVLDLGLDVLRFNGQGGEDGKVDGVGVGAAAVDDEVLVESRECKFAG